MGYNIKQSNLFWILAFIITAASAVYQRVTGPTYAYSGKAALHGEVISYKFERAHTGKSNHVVMIKTNDQKISGLLLWKRYKTGDEWIKVPMTYDRGILSAEIPNQLPAAKLEYHVMLGTSTQRVVLPENRNIVLRFRGDVPIPLLHLHILAMFMGMLLSTRTGLEAFSKAPNIKKFIYWIVGFLAVGGCILGPIVQWYAFGSFWTGWPVGNDLTDNKTAVTVLVWLVAAFALNRAKNPKRWVLTAALVTLIVYLIPHSLLGSELPYTGPEKQKIVMITQLLYPIL